MIRLCIKRLHAALVLALTLTVPSQAEEPARQSNPNSIGMQFVAMAPGEYRRGFDGSGQRDRQFALAHSFSNPQAFRFDSPSHLVVITKPFELQTTEVTVAQFREFVEATGYQTEAESNGGALGCFPEEKDYVDRFRKSPDVTWRTPGFEQSDDHPVVAVSWNDAVKFCEWLSEQETTTYRLPTEAEWEYACRAGQSTWYSWGSDPDEAYVHANVADGALEAAQPNTTRYQRAVKLEADAGDGVVFTAAVASFRPNPWGLHDMHGNVWEWCQDRWSADLYRRYLDDVPWPKRSQFTVTDPVMLEETPQHAYGDWRCIRGGAWTCAPASVRCSIRTFAEASDATIYTGFRVVRESQTDATNDRK
ncbi:formylglycine-generating enzyme family protein [Rhodopirellula baltica]|uniref:Formylglycine-generating sulfatase n=1 Tax=Rhodopirellula baltica WH47 TaxID=991778 RepID=F2ATN3_RHOBT|nr:formylglycine-generating enzyme family protein [Rhodopirellula baltica]EGF26867.1 Formylglycine-generating sulfatase [Rhodopirellula baltica WH47]